MKIQKGLLSTPERTGSQTPSVPPVAPLTRTPAKQGAEPEKNRLFETLEKGRSSSRSYAKLFAVAALIVVIAGGLVFYLTLPKAGDTVRAPKGLEQAVRDHLQEKQKRDATDITFYYCGPDFYWARSGVETRKDIPNPVYRIAMYAVTAKGSDGNWQIASKPINAADDDNPCS